MSTPQILLEALAFGLLVNLWLFLIMRFSDPRVWGYNDYPDHIKANIPVQTSTEKRQAFLLGLPWLIISFGFPIYRIWLLKASQSNEISFSSTFSVLMAYFLFVSLIDLVVLDYWLISRNTPDFVVMQGTNAEDYKDLSVHYRLQVLALIPISFLLALVAWIVTIL